MADRNRSKKVLGYARIGVTYDGHILIPNAKGVEMTRLRRMLASNSPQETAYYDVEISRPIGSRSINQNALMWKLLRKMAEHTDGGRIGITTAEDCYMELLEEFGCIAHYLILFEPAAIDQLLDAYHIVRPIEKHPDGSLTVKCIAGSSHFNKKEMHDFIELIFDRLADMGVEDPEIQRAGLEWRAANE